MVPGGYDANDPPRVTENTLETITNAMSVLSARNARYTRIRDEGWVASAIRDNILLVSSVAGVKTF